MALELYYLSNAYKLKKTFLSIIYHRRNLRASKVQRLKFQLILVVLSKTNVAVDD
jgi:hypothetical protein